VWRRDGIEYWSAGVSEYRSIEADLVGIRNIYSEKFRRLKVVVERLPDEAAIATAGGTKNSSPPLSRERATRAESLR
jgi:hypothetical protein